jgi:urea transport system permease protein
VSRFGGSLLHGLSLASVLLFVALGLAITFGLLGVINMAHGEMLMLGAYATYTVQTLMHGHRFYLLAAIPVAFLATGGVGVVMERSIIRHLYGRPLETLLATWGISLVLIQTIRLIFGAQNVSVANPDWLAGGTLIAQGLVLPWSRIAVVGFVILVAAGVWFILQRTRLGLQVRAVTQNRAMASCLGVPPVASTRWCSASARASRGWAASRCRSSATSAPRWAELHHRRVHGRRARRRRAGWRAPSRRRWAWA